jgi:tetratricopeptide (TPR) repeat protein
MHHSNSSKMGTEGWVWYFAILIAISSIVLVLAYPLPLFNFNRSKDDLSYLLKEGSMHLQNHLYEEAISDYSRALDIIPLEDQDNRSAALSARALAYHNKGFYKKAIEDISLTIIVEKDRYNQFQGSSSQTDVWVEALASSYTLRANAYTMLGKYREALDDWRQKLILVPDDRLALEEEVNLLCDLKCFDESLAKAEQLLERYHDAGAYYQSGYVRFVQGNYSGAIPFFSKAIDLRSDFAEAYYARGNSKYQLDQLDEAESDRLRAVKINASLESKKYGKIK